MMGMVPLAMAQAIPICEQERLRVGELCSGMGEQTLVRADIDRTEMVIAYAKEPDLYLVVEMRHNPLGIDWQITADSTF